MEIAIIGFLVVIISGLIWLLSRAMNRTDRCFVMINDLISTQKKTQGLVRESQDNFKDLVKLANEEDTNFWKLGGHWANKAEQAGLVYCLRKLDDNIYVYIGLKGWDIDQCEEHGNVFCVPFHHQPKKIMKTLSSMFIRELMERYKKELSKPKREFSKGFGGSN